MLLRSNQAKNVPVLVEDINLAKKIFKVDVATRKVKSMRPLPPIVTINDMVKLPMELETSGRDI